MFELAGTVCKQKMHFFSLGVLFPSSVTSFTERNVYLARVGEHTGVHAACSNLGDCQVGHASLWHFDVSLVARRAALPVFVPSPRKRLPALRHCQTMPAADGDLRDRSSLQCRDPPGFPHCFLPASSMPHFAVMKAGRHIHYSETLWGEFGQTRHPTRSC